MPAAIEQGLLQNNYKTNKLYSKCQGMFVGRGGGPTAFFCYTQRVITTLRRWSAAKATYTKHLRAQVAT